MMAGIVASQLQKHQIQAVLTGGAVVTIYTRRAYQSYDLDFVTHAGDKKIKTAMTEIGFRRPSGRHYTHPQSDFYVEFLSPPLAIGDKPVQKWAIRKTPYGKLQLLDPTQSVMDRLAAWYHWNDLESLDQALAVALRHRIRITEIQRWSRLERMSHRYLEFLKILRKQRKKNYA